MLLSLCLSLPLADQPERETTVSLTQPREIPTTRGTIPVFMAACFLSSPRALDPMELNPTRMLSCVLSVTVYHSSVSSLHGRFHLHAQTDGDPEKRRETMTGRTTIMYDHAFRPSFQRKSSTSVVSAEAEREEEKASRTPLTLHGGFVARGCASHVALW